MSADVIAQKIKELIANGLDHNIEQVTDDCDLQRDLGADSLDLTELLMTIEEEFDIDFDENDMSELVVKDIISLVKSKMD
jgi:acyl carrier protein